MQLTHIFNACIKMSYFPKNWKLAKILPFHKPGKDKHLPQSYRPISLLPTLGKILEMIVNKRLKAYITENNVLIAEQFGFRKSHSTVQTLARLTDFISTNFNINKSTGLLLLDIEKAFDTVWHEALIFKLNNYNVPLYIIKFIDDYLSNRAFAVNVRDKSSSTRTIVAGVPQGSILGPMLFILYINDIPKHDKTQIAIFADDTAIYSASWSKDVALKNLQDHISVLEAYYLKWKIKINVTKTDIIIFSHKNKKPNKQIKMYGESLEITNKVKYLGLILDPKLSFTHHVLAITRKVNAAISILYPLICRSSVISQKNKSTIYNVCILPIILYACPIWSNTYKTNYSKLQTLQNKCLRMITNSQWDVKNEEIHKILNVQTLKETVKTLTMKFYTEKLNLDVLLNVCQTKTKHPYAKYKVPQQILIDSNTGDQ